VAAVAGNDLAIKDQACAMDERACVGDLAAGLALAPSTVSHHLKELRQCGLIHMERRGQHVQCWAEPETLASLERFFATATRDGVTTC
jgi:ArsR family transcriptional regulator